MLALSITATAAPAPSVRLWRLDCGTVQVNDLNVFSDTYAYVGQSKRLTASCYLIKHDDTYMLWDTGLPESSLGASLSAPGAMAASLSHTIKDQLSELNVAPTSLSLIGISHYHWDHTGQAASFPQAKLLMGKGDIDALRKPGNESAKPLEHWLSGGGALEEVTGDKDVFGDGSVVMLDLPGHTPGHHGLLVKLAKTGYVLLSGDAVHFRENYEKDGVPAFNDDRIKSIASIERFREIAKNLKAVTIIQHEPEDVGKLPQLPKFAD
ncbi:MAG TPA: N-acyl homoserine lactonase family protein [Candidatus Sulfotelmatobacter sp.]|nr:N-acyl homoserine lactonase family protein [Candidatus Sulfotelmatobacter sp.]